MLPWDWTWAVWAARVELGFELLYSIFGFWSGPNWREGSYGGSGDIQETREAVASAGLTILRSKRYKELF